MVPGPAIYADADAGLVLPAPVHSPSRSPVRRPPSRERPRPTPNARGGPGKQPRRSRRNDRSVRRQGTLTVEGGEAIPLATTTSVLLPCGVPRGRVNLVEELVPGWTDTEVQPLVRA